MQTERKEIYSIRREFGGCDRVVRLSAVLFCLRETGGQYPPDGDAGGDDGDDGNRTVCVCAGSLF